jgi:hypothetical protein
MAGGIWSPAAPSRNPAVGITLQPPPKTVAQSASSSTEARKARPMRSGRYGRRATAGCWAATPVTPPTFWTAGWMTSRSGTRSFQTARSPPAAGASAMSGGGLDGLFATDLAASMWKLNRCLASLPFYQACGCLLRSTSARVRYNDGFVAWLNGVEMARRNAPQASGGIRPRPPNARPANPRCRRRSISPHTSACCVPAPTCSLSTA